jgi:HEAT repeat protein
VVFRTALADQDSRVRLPALREVRVAVAAGLGAVEDPSSAPVLAELSTDPDPLVRAAACEAAGELGCPVPLDRAAVQALADPAWQVRRGAALALTTVTREVAIEALVPASRDAHLDVRKAAVGSLSRWAGDPDVSVASKAALDDSDADVRAIARHALRTEQ